MHPCIHPCRHHAAAPESCGDARRPVHPRLRPLLQALRERLQAPVRQRRPFGDQKRRPLPGLAAGRPGLSLPARVPAV